MTEDQATLARFHWEELPSCHDPCGLSQGFVCDDMDISSPEMILIFSLLQEELESLKMKLEKLEKEKTSWKQHCDKLETKVRINSWSLHMRHFS